MKKIIPFTLLLITLFITILSANTKENYAFVSLYELHGESHRYEYNRTGTIFQDTHIHINLFKSTNKTLTLQEIIQKKDAFKPIPKTETFTDDTLSYWLQVDLGDTFPSGTYVVQYGDAKIIEDSFTPLQHASYINVKGAQHLSFTYQHSQDATQYYFKLKPQHFRIPFRYISISPKVDFYNSIMDTFTKQLMLGIVLGIIFMAAIYNGAMYYYNRQRSFLYYMCMQFFMIAILFAILGLYIYDANSFFSRNIMYENLISLGASFFATLFSIHFLDIQKYLPKLYLILRSILALIILDMLVTLFDQSYIYKYYLIPFFMLFLLYAGIMRIKQGYKPAQFYLAGWLTLTLSVFLTVFSIGMDYLHINPLFIGSAVEAILLSIALSYKIRMIYKAKEEQKELLVHQSKLASMGEMLANIAHQWRQPLTHLSYTFMNIKEAQTYGELHPEYLDKKIDDANTQLIFMSQTIDDFKDFYASDKEKEDFSLAQASKETLAIMKNTFTHQNIKVTLNIHEDSRLHNYKNEYKQVLLNLLSNAKDALLKNVTVNPQIDIIIDKNYISVSDNAGGINPAILPKIFDPYFTTKEGNSGIGLYMSKMIVERNMHAKLQITSHPKGTQCTLTF